MWRHALVVGVFYLATIRAGQGWGDDFAQYIQHARNIATGVPYAQTGYIYNPHNPALGPRAYPPGFPVLLAPVVRLFGLDFRAMKVLIVLCFVGVLLLVPQVFGRDLPRPYVAALVLLFGLNPFMWEFKDQVLSDVPFLLFTLLAIYGFQRQSAALAGFATYAAIATRVLGIVLVPCFVAHDLMQRRRVGPATAVGCGIALALAAGQYLLGVRDGSYVNTLVLSAATAGRNVVDYLRALSDIWDDGYTATVRKVVFLLTIGFTTYGYTRSVRSGLTVIEIFPALYVVPIILWPAYQGTRLLIPLIPFYLYYCLQGLRGLEQRVAARSRTLQLACIAIVLLVYAARYTTLRFGPMTEGVATAESEALFRFVKTSTAAGDVFIFSKPRALALFTGRRAAAPSIEAEPCELWRFMLQIGATYVVTGPAAVHDDATVGSLDQFVARFPQSLQLVMRNDEIAAYRVVGDPCRGSGLGLVA